ncbi:MAG: rhodanese-like domain-containing protein [Gammaproteobacteria bacterium]|nr:rhodanese-like domain-containing protein [Gammaproteobacteria bacterium]MDX2487598.1 rhodanese-like domain-containing protein [Gammaproteobacteria bacterium]
MEFIAQNWVLIAGIFVVALLLVSEPLRMRISGVEAANVFDAVSLSNHQSAIFVDVRESKETADGVINGAYRVPLSNFDKNATQLDKFKEKPVIVYCRSGNRSIGAAGKLRKKGFNKVYSLTGGILAWQKEKLPLES